MARFATPTTGRRYYGINGHGDLTWTATESAAVSKTVRYDPWGQAIAAPSGQPDFGFQGSWLDPATDLYWVIARWYAPGLGTFVSEDELLGEPINPLSRHLYACGGGDPVSKWDPDGRVMRRVSKRVTVGWRLGLIKVPGVHTARFSAVWDESLYLGLATRIRNLTMDMEYLAKGCFKALWGLGARFAAPALRSKHATATPDYSGGAVLARIMPAGGLHACLRLPRFLLALPCPPAQNAQDRVEVDTHVRAIQ